MGRGINLWDLCPPGLIGDLFIGFGEPLGEAYSRTSSSHPSPKPKSSQCLDKNAERLKEMEEYVRYPRHLQW